jgi:TIR domain
MAPVLDSRFAAMLEELDWIVVDLGPASAACGIIGYLHGRSMPMLRLCRVSSEQPDGGVASQLEATLFGSYEVGYPKDIVRWSDELVLEPEIERRILRIYAERTLIVSLDQAVRYFRGAALRKDAVFVTYSGDDADAVSPIIAALQERFQQVFDYRAHDQPTPAGTQWIEEIFKQIAARPLGVILLSSAYLRSGNCRHEADEMIARRDNGKMQVIPIKLGAGELELPPLLRSTQYLRAWEYDDARGVVADVIRAVDTATGGQG